jgi:hypothetical protein
MGEQHTSIFDLIKMELESERVTGRGTRGEGGDMHVQMV